MSEDAAAFQSEHEMVVSFVSSLRSADTPWGNLDVGEEFFYVSGRTDVVAVDSDRVVIAFEAKLSRWREALHQAYRNTCFAHQSYVLLPERVARRAYERVEEFVRRRVGLCYLGADGPVVLHPAEHAPPIQPWLSEMAIAHASPAEGDAEPS